MTAVTTACLSEQGFLRSGLKEARMMSHDMLASIIQPKEILIARSNTDALVGRVAMFQSSLDSKDGIVASDLVIRIIADNQRLIPEFLNKFLSHLFLRGYWRNNSKGTSGSMKKITRAQLSVLGVPLPPIENQLQIVEKFKALQDITQTNAESEKKIEELKSSLLQKAFRGEL